VCTERTTFYTVENSFIRQRWDEVFSGTLTQMKVVSLGNIANGNGRARLPNYQLPNVVSLEMSFNPTYDHHEVRLCFVCHCPSIFPDASESKGSWSTMSDTGICREQT
jgi:hypothetical protein